MEGTCLKIKNPIRDAISKIRFSPRSNNLMISSWDSNLRLFDVDSHELRLEAPTKAALLDCCFQDESVAFSVGSDCSVRRYDLCSGIQNKVGNHDDLATCIEYSVETSQLITAGLDKKILFWDMHKANDNIRYLKRLDAEVESMSLCGLHLILAVGTTVSMYDLRNLNGPAEIRESPMDYRIGCICSFSNSQGYALGSIEGCVALEFFDPSDSMEKGYVFRCHPKSKHGRYDLAAVNAIEFHPCYGTFVTGDNDGYTIIWDGQSRKKLFEFPRYPGSVASLSYNYGGQLLAVSSSYTYQEANEVEEAPQIFVHEINENFVRPFSSRRSK